MSVLDNSTAQQILDGAEIGKRIAVVVENMRVGELLFTQLLDGNDMHPDMFKVYRARREIRTETGGIITITSQRSGASLRGMSLDRVYLDQAISDPDVLASIYPSLDVRGGNLIRFSPFVD